MAGLLGQQTPSMLSFHRSINQKVSLLIYDGRERIEKEAASAEEGGGSSGSPGLAPDAWLLNLLHCL